MIPAKFDYVRPGSLAEAVGMENLAALRDAVRQQIEREYSGIADRKSVV